MSTEQQERVTCDFPDCGHVQSRKSQGPILEGGWVRWRFAMLVGNRYITVGTIDFCPDHSSHVPERVMRSNTRDDKHIELHE